MSLGEATLVLMVAGATLVAIILSVRVIRTLRRVIDLLDLVEDDVRALRREEPRQ